MAKAIEGLAGLHGNRCGQEAVSEPLQRVARMGAVLVGLEIGKQPGPSSFLLIIGEPQEADRDQLGMDRDLPSARGSLEGLLALARGVVIVVRGYDIDVP